MKWPSNDLRTQLLATLRLLGAGEVYVEFESYQNEITVERPSVHRPDGQIVDLSSHKMVWKGEELWLYSALKHLTFEAVVNTNLGHRNDEGMQGHLEIKFSPVASIVLQVGVNVTRVETNYFEWTER